MNEEMKQEEELNTPTTPSTKRTEPRDTLIELALFSGIAIISFVGFVLFTQTTFLIASFADTIILIVDTFICVKAFRAKKTILAVLLIVFIAPAILMLFLFGACAFLLSGGSL